MSARAAWFEQTRSSDELVIAASGDWRVKNLSSVDGELRALDGGEVRRATIDLKGLNRLDTTGAWALYRTLRDLRAKGIAAEYVGGTAAQLAMLKRIAATDRPEDLSRDEPHPVVAMIERTGQAVFSAYHEGTALLAFLGAAVIALVKLAARPGRIRFVSFMSHLEQVGLNAMPIVGLLSFLIGIVLAYQGADQLRQFGAEIFTVNLLGVAMLREMGILLTAIIIAGRSGSAFTAQIGTMQVNQEIDAMRAIGLDPMEVLVLPRVMALLVALPLLAVFANFMGITGGMMMSILMLDISFVQFMERLKAVVPISAFWVGMIKAPVFGFTIGLVGCREGMAVRGSAESVGRQTTRSVVVSIFLVIVLDALFSVVFSYVGV